jgi:ornithine--oxo-acid transaminase
MRHWAVRGGELVNHRSQVIYMPNSSVPSNTAPGLNVAQLYADNEADRYELHARHLNEQMVRVLRTIGYDVSFRRGAGQYLYDRDGAKYLDLLSGYGVFAVGRNHPALREALKSVLDAELPNLVQMDVSPLAGLLAEQLLAFVPYLDKVFFANSGSEATEAAIKFVRAATGRPGLVYCDHAFHGLTNGSLSLNGDGIFRTGFEPLLPQCRVVPFNDLDALERALALRDVAAFIVEPIQGKGVNLPADDYLPEAARLCRKYGTLFVADEVQTGMGRTGRFLAIEHWNVEADMVLLAKALSGGHVPVGAVELKRAIFDRVFDRMDRAVVHGSTFSKTDLAMAAGLATLSVIEDEGLIERARRRGAELLADFAELQARHEMIVAVRGKGLMIGIEFGCPDSLKLKIAWRLLDQLEKGLFCQMVIMPLFAQHRIIAQVAGHRMPVIKLLPPYVISDEDRVWIREAFDAVLTDCRSVRSSVLPMMRDLAAGAMRDRVKAE